MDAAALSLTRPSRVGCGTRLSCKRGEAGRALPSGSASRASDGSPDDKAAEVMSVPHSVRRARGKFGTEVGVGACSIKSIPMLSARKLVFPSVGHDGLEKPSNLGTSENC